MRRTVYQRMSPSQRAGVVAASASVPVSLVPLLRPRTAVDQGLITGLSAAMSYGLTTVTHDAVLGTARGLLRLARVPVDAQTTARTTLAVDLVALAAASAVHAALPRREEEPIAVAQVRVLARRVATAAVAGMVPSILDGWSGRSRLVGAAVRSGPVAVLAGAGISAGLQYARLRRLVASGVIPSVGQPAPMASSLGVGALTAAGAVALAAGERRIASGAERAIEQVSGARGYGPAASHLVSAAAITGALAGLAAVVTRREERAATTPDGASLPAPASPLVSGGSGSAVAWDRLTREPRRHLTSATPAASIASVMGEPAREPIRVYVGLTSAPTVAARVALALNELERTGALDRSLLVLCSPTGTGCVNHTAVSAWEYLSRGDCATLTLQYSVRPSMLSLDRVNNGREQNTAMWSALAERLARRPPAERPRVVVFGESLGAFTAQEVFLRTGTHGLRMCFIERALWLGTPWASRWAREVLSPFRADVHPGEVLPLASADDLDDLDPGLVRAARYVLLSHHDDGVTLFSPGLLVRRPAWLGSRRPPDVPPQATWSTPITFLQTAIDAKNALPIPIPGEFVACGHDYRADLARAVRFAFDLPCSADQLAAVEEALRADEVIRAARWL